MGWSAIEMGLSSVSFSWRKLSSCRGGAREQLENFYGAFEDWGSCVHIYPERALFSLLTIRMKTYQEVKLSSRKELSSRSENSLD